MQRNSPSPERDLVLIGGGHTHALVLRAWANPARGTRITLIEPNKNAAYSGMLPGFIAGHYARQDLNIDLVRLAQSAGARIVLHRACGIDRARQRVQLEGHPDISYDVLSIDIGITNAMPALDGFSRYAVPAKPLGPFATRWHAYVHGSAGAAHVAILGGGVAGAELALAMAHALEAIKRPAHIHIIERARALSALSTRAARRMRGALHAYGVELHEYVQAKAITADHVELSDGTQIRADFVTGVAGARPYPWLKDTGLTDSAGFIPVGETLQSLDNRIFAAGDCAEMPHAPRAKAGVYAVRQAPILTHNLRAYLQGNQKLRPYRPQQDYLKLISLGTKAALGERLGLTFAGPWVWRWKNRIDQRFMQQFRAYGDK